MAKSGIMQTTPYDRPGTSFFGAKDSAKLQRGHPQLGPQTEVGYVKIGDFRPISRYITEAVQDRDIVTMEG